MKKRNMWGKDEEEMCGGRMKKRNARGKDEEKECLGEG